MLEAHIAKDNRGKRANETSQVDLLQRDVGILLKEVRELRTENDRLKEQNERLKDRINGNEQAEKDELAFYISSQREGRGFSLNHFARLLKSNSTTLRNYEKGKGNLNAMRDMAERIRKLGRV